MAEILDKYFLITKYPFWNKRQLTNRENNFIQYVYLILNPLTKAYKIGITNDYHRRYDALEGSAGCALKTVLVLELAYFDESAKHIEKFLHSYYKNKRFIGEWFLLSKKDIRDILNLFYKIDGEYIYGDFEEISTPFTYERYSKKWDLTCVG